MRISCLLILLLSLNQIKGVETNDTPSTEPTRKRATNTFMPENLKNLHSITNISPNNNLHITHFVPHNFQDRIESGKSIISNIYT